MPEIARRIDCIVGRKRARLARMTKDQLEGVLEGCGAAKDDAGWKFAEGVAVSLHLSRGPGAMTVAKVSTIRVEKSLVMAVTGRGDRFAFDLADLLVVQVEGSKEQAPRRAGF